MLASHVPATLDNKIVISYNALQVTDSLRLWLKYYLKFILNFCVRLINYGLYRKQTNIIALFVLHFCQKNAIIIINIAIKRPNSSSTK